MLPRLDLSRGSILKSSNSSKRNDAPKVQFENSNLNNVLKDYIFQKDRKPYEDLIVKLKQPNLGDEELDSFIQEASKYVTLLDEKVYQLVQTILAIQWTKRRLSVVRNFQEFLTNLVSAHIYYTYDVYECLISCFLVTDSEDDWFHGFPTDSEEKLYGYAHRVIEDIVKMIPMSTELLLEAMTNSFPYSKCNTHIQESYVYNLLTVTSYQQSLRLDIIFLIFERLLDLDVAIQPSDVYSSLNEDGSMEDKSDCNARPHTLDQLLTVLFCYCERNSSNLLELTRMYRSFLNCFEKAVLPAQTTHIQFVLFYMCSFKQNLAQEFLNSLWGKVISPNVASVIRQNAVSYIAGLLTRARYITPSMFKRALIDMADWIHNYISNHEYLDKVPTIHLHPVFYATCQSFFYMINIKHKELVSSKKNITFLQSLNFSRIVTSRLNPLRFCTQAVTTNFAAVTQKYQLAYCYSIIEENSRNAMLPIVYTDDRGVPIFKADLVLTDCFPFDTLLLPLCKKVIAPLYHSFENSDIDYTPAEDGPVFEDGDYFLKGNSDSSAMSCDTDLYGLLSD